MSPVTTSNIVTRSFPETRTFNLSKPTIETLFNQTTLSRFPIKFPFLTINQTPKTATTTSTQTQNQILSLTTTISSTYKLKKFTRKYLKLIFLLRRKKNY